MFFIFFNIDTFRPPCDTARMNDDSQLDGDSPDGLQDVPTGALHTADLTPRGCAATPATAPDEIESEIAEAEDRLICAQMDEADIECCGTAEQRYWARQRIKDCERELWALKEKHD